MKLQKILDSLPTAKDLEERAQGLSRDALIVLANLKDVKNFSKEIILKDFEGNEVPITLPEGCRTPQEAANAMFSLSKKLSKKARNTHVQVENLKSKIDFWQREIAYVKNVSSITDLGIIEPKKTLKKTSSRFEEIYVEGIKISMGRNKSENQALLEDAKADDLWLHVRDVPSAHMIIRCGKNKVHEDVILKAGEILVGLNPIQIGSFTVDCTKRKFVKMIEGANVIYAKHKSFHYKKPF